MHNSAAPGTPCELSPRSPEVLLTSPVAGDSSTGAPVQPCVQTTIPAGYKIVIKAGRSERLYWRDLWRYRALLLLLAYRDTSIHYKQTIIGIAWALVPPLTTMLVFVLVFCKVATLPSGALPSPLLVPAV